MSVFANGRSILHKGHGKTQLAIAPDVCKTPSPGGPVPIPYPNMSADSNLTKGAESVKINGNPVANTDSQLSRSNGDEAGVAGGVVSSKNMGAFGWPVGSIDVQAEGKGVVRLLDSCLTNGNAYNDTGLDVGETGLGYGDDAVCPREDCELERVLEKHRVPETKDVADACTEFLNELETEVPGHMSGSRYGRMIGVGLCKCQVWKAVSGVPMEGAALDRMDGVPGFCNTVAERPGDTQFTVIQRTNPQWQCAALKILSNAKGHKIEALSEKWYGNKHKKSRRVKFVGGNTNFTLPVALAGGAAGLLAPSSRADRVAGQPPGDEIPHGGSVPSCGTCQTFLPALVCKMEPCP